MWPAKRCFEEEKKKKKKKKKEEEEGEEKEKEEGEEEKKEEEEESRLKQKSVEISAVHHIVPSRQKQKTSYNIQEYYRSKYNPGYKNINALLSLYKEEIFYFLQISNINDIVYKYDSIVDHIQKHKKQYQKCRKKTSHVENNSFNN